VGYFGIVFLISGTITLVFLADRLLAPRLPALLSTLVFPCAYVLVEWISAQLNPFGTWGSEAYTQSGNLPLMQLASLTGLTDINDPYHWSESLCERLAIDQCRLPGIAGPAEVIGGVSKATAEETGLPEGTPVVCGCGDVVASAFWGWCAGRRDPRSSLPGAQERHHRRQ
jgi:hypothetical protein